MNKKMLWILCLALAVVLIGASFLYRGFSGQVQTQGLATQMQATTEPPVPSHTSGEPDQTTEAPAETAPDVTVLDWEGNERTLSEFRGKPVVLNFWASWCGPCKSEMPEFQAAYEAYGEQIHFLMVNCTGGRETVDSAKAFIEQQGYTFPVYFDTTYEAASVYGASSIPLTYFIDAQGYAVAYGRGALDGETLQRGIDMIYTPETTE